MGDAHFYDFNNSSQQPRIFFPKGDRGHPGCLLFFWVRHLTGWHDYNVFFSTFVNLSASCVNFVTLLYGEKTKMSWALVMENLPCNEVRVLNKWMALLHYRRETDTTLTYKHITVFFFLTVSFLVYIWFTVCDHYIDINFINLLYIFCGTYLCICLNVHSHLTN